MRRIASLLLVVFIFLIAADGRVCADGCRDDEPQHSDDVSRSSDCTLCATSVLPVEIPVPLTPLLVELPFAPSPAALRLPSPPARIDHPPQLT